jgi:hypothetical protein
MSDLASELKFNYGKFRATLRKDFVATDKAIDADGKIFLDAYKRLAAINSWRADVLTPLINTEVLGFILEAQNDGICSLAFATVGAWRTSLQSLRSMIENAMLGLYFADHPIEHQLWLEGSFKMGFGALAEYFKAHPAHRDLPNQVDPIPLLRQEYDTLSRAVHGRAPFRMTKDAASTVVCNPSAALRGAYLTRQRETLRSISLLKLMLFSQHLQGTKQQGLRSLLSQTFSSQVKTVIRSNYSVVLT